MPSFRIELLDYAAGVDALRQVRGPVFEGELGVPAALHWDALDLLSTHALARDADGAAIGCGRLTPEHRVGRLAVLPPWRGRGVGGALLRALLEHARQQGWRQVALDAEAAAATFYARHGFVPEGERFVEAGIVHQPMRRTLQGAQAIERPEQAAAVTCAVAAGARRSLYLYSRDLDPGLLDRPMVLETLRRLAVRVRGAEIRVLLQDVAAPQQVSAPLLALAQRLPSHIALRKIQDPVDLAYPSAFIVNDLGGYYFRLLGHRLEGEADIAGGGRARQLREEFASFWERARPCTELRALGL